LGLEETGGKTQEINFGGNAELIRGNFGEVRIRRRRKRTKFRLWGKGTNRKKESRPDELD